MRPSAIAAWRKWNQPNEGQVAWNYASVLYFPTMTLTGNLTINIPVDMTGTLYVIDASAERDQRARRLRASPVVSGGHVPGG